MKLFSADNKAVQLVDIFLDYIWVTILTILFSLPIVTIGAALTAKYYTAMKIARGEAPQILSAFIKAFKDNFKQGVILELISALAITVLAIDWYIVFCFNFGLGSYVLLSVVGVVTLIFAIILSFSFPLLARFNAGTFYIIKSALMIGIGRLWVSILLVLCNVCVVVACFEWCIYIPFILLIGGAIALASKSHLLVMVLKKIEENEDIEKE